MSQNNLLLQGYDWDAPTYEDPQHQNSRLQQQQQQRDEVISVYEIYVKDEDTVNPTTDGKILSSVIPAGGLIVDSGNQLIQAADCVVELDGVLESESNDPTGEKFTLKETIIGTNDKLDIVGNIDEKFLPYSSLHPVSRSQPSAVTRLVDKDDPRSRLHFVKYMKRDGKTLKIWECGICSKEFRHQYTLMRHLPTHTDERNFKCETCGKAFRQLSTLSQHRAIHSDARPYVCEYCKKTFNRVSTLISHRKTHSDDKPHKCEMCGKGFHQKGNLRNHVFTHTNERPYKCGLCGKGFNQMSNLMCHKIKSHANIERSLPYGCTVCGKKFLRRFALRSHEERKHGVKYSQDKNASDNARINSGIIADGFHSPERFPQDNIGETDDLVVDAIRTKAMKDAVSLGHTPFALFKPSNGVPILVKVSPAVNTSGKQILSPATAEDLKLAGRMCLGTATLIDDTDGVKAVQIKVPVVATVTQTLDIAGNFNYVIASEQDQEAQLVETQFTYSELADQSPAHLVTLAANQDPLIAKVPFSHDADVQYIRATEDGRYEMMTNTEAIDLMALNSHDVTVLNDAEVAAMAFADSNKSVVNDFGRKNIEVFGGKDFRILGAREERFFNDDVSLMEQSKIEDLILGSSDVAIDGAGFSPVQIDSGLSCRNRVEQNEYRRHGLQSFVDLG